MISSVIAFLQNGCEGVGKDFQWKGGWDSRSSLRRTREVSVSNLSSSSKILINFSILAMVRIKNSFAKASPKTGPSYADDELLLCACTRLREGIIRMHLTNTQPFQLPIQRQKYVINCVAESWRPQIFHLIFIIYYVKLCCLLARA